MENIIKKEIRVAIYTRVSTQKQEKDWFWLDFQKEALFNLIDYKSINDNWITKEEWHYSDSLSWKDLNRPGFQRMMSDMKEWKFDIIICYKLDRISRSLTHLLKVFDDLKKYWVWFHSIKENIDFSWPIWTLTLQIFWAISQFEREIIKMRTQDGIKSSAKSWNYTFGAAPYGFKKVKNEWEKWSKLEIVWIEKVIVEKIYNLFYHENQNYSQIGEYLTNEKIPKWQWWVRKNIENTEWYDTTVKDVLISTANAWYTIREFQNDDGTTDEVIVNNEPIISKVFFDLVQKKVKIVEDNNKWWERKYLLSWKIRDLETWRKFVWALRTKDNKHSYRRKKFIKDDIIYEWMEIPWEPLDDYVWSFLSDFLNQPELFYKKFLEWNNFSKDILLLKEEKKILEKKIYEEETIIDKVERMFLLWKMSEEKSDKKIEESTIIMNQLNSKIICIDENINKLLDVESVNNILKEISKNFKWKIDSMSLQDKMIFVEMLIEEIVVYNNDDWDIQVDIKFRFQPPNDDRNWGRFEPKDDLDIKKSPTKDLDFDLNGAPSRIRTHGWPRFAAWRSSNWAMEAYKHKSEGIL